MDIVSLLGAVVHSAWLFPVLAVLIAFDGPLPMLPSETLLVTAAAVAFEDGNLGAVAALFLVAVVGSVGGDLACFGLGRSASKLIKHPPEGRWADWVRRNLLTRPGVALIGARFLPGGRLVSTVGAGRFGLPMRRFAPWALASSAFWAVYMLSIGRLLQPLAGSNPLLCVGAHMLIGLLTAGLFTLAGRFLSRRAVRAAAVEVAEDEAAGPAAAPTTLAA